MAQPLLWVALTDLLFLVTLALFQFLQITRNILIYQSCYISTLSLSLSSLLHIPNIQKRNLCVFCNTLSPLHSSINVQQKGRDCQIFSHTLKYQKWCWPSKIRPLLLANYKKNTRIWCEKKNGQ